MSYPKQKFISGQTLKASHLNHMEDYIEYSVEYVDYLLDELKKIQESGGNVGISSVKQTTTSTADGGTNVVTVTLTDGTTSTFQVKNGSKGSTPVKGTDYFTDTEKDEMVSAVIDALPVYNGEVVAV